MFGISNVRSQIEESVKKLLENAAISREIVEKEFSLFKESFFEEKKLKEVREEIKEKKELYFSLLLPPRIYGSNVHETNLPFSDIDILVVFEREKLRSILEARNEKEDFPRYGEQSISGIWNDVKGEIMSYTLNSVLHSVNMKNYGKHYHAIRKTEILMPGVEFSVVVYPSLITRNKWPLEVSVTCLDEGVKDIVEKKGEFYKNFFKNKPNSKSAVVFFKYFMKRFISSRNLKTDKKRYPGGIFFEHLVCSEHNKKYSEDQDSKFWELVTICLERIRCFEMGKGCVFDNALKKIDGFHFSNHEAFNNFKCCFTMLQYYLENGIKLPSDFDYDPQEDSGYKLAIWHKRTFIENSKKLLRGTGKTVCACCKEILSRSKFSKGSWKKWKKSTCLDCSREMRQLPAKRDSEYLICFTCKNKQKVNCFSSSNRSSRSPICESCVYMQKPLQW